MPRVISARIDAGFDMPRAARNAALIIVTIFCRD